MHAAPSATICGFPLIGAARKPTPAPAAAARRPGAADHHGYARGVGVGRVANTADRPLAAVATRDVAAVAAALLLDPSWSGQARVPVAGPDNLTSEEMAEVISQTVGHTVHYRQIPVADQHAAMLQRGANLTMAQDLADMIEAQNDGIYDAEPRDPNAAAPTGFRTWCQDTLKPVIEA